MMCGLLLLTLALPAADPKPELANRALNPEAIAHWELAQYHESRRSKIWTAGPALVSYAKAIEIEPQYAAPYLDRGRLYFERDQLDEALADYDAAVRLLPQFAGAFVSRGDLHLHRGDDRKALADFDAAIRLLDASNRPIIVGNHQNSVRAWRGLDYAYARRCLARLFLKDRVGAQADLESAVQNLRRFVPSLSEEDLKRANGRRAGHYQLAAAWVLATHPDADVRDGRLAQQLVAKVQDPDPDGLGEVTHDTDPVRAAVAAELGRFAEAVRWEKKYLDRVSRMAWGTPWSGSRYRSGEYEDRRPLRSRSTWFLPEKP
jgi:tetratricopeptide (TPR) repeat protein